MNNKSAKSYPENIGRRDFIRKSAMVCCMMNIPWASRSLSKSASPTIINKDVNPVELVTYCGLYCGACDIYQKRIANLGNELKELLEALDFNEIAPQVPGLEDYKTFDKFLNNLITIFGQCAGCQKGGGPPQCQIRICCREKGYQTCAECPSLPCDEVKPNLDSYPPAKKNLEDIKTIGLEKWSQKMQEKVNKGYKFSDNLIKKKKTGAR